MNDGPVTLTAAARDALEAVYRAFADVPRPLRVERYGEPILQFLISKPLRELLDDWIGPYSGWAITTAGTERDYQYFLPRILEVALLNPVWMGTEPAVVASRLKMAGWESWPSAQRRAIVSVFEQAFLSNLERYSCSEEWLCGLASLGQPVERYLKTWVQSPSPGATFALAQFVTGTDLDRGEVAGGYWDEAEPALRRVIGTWVRSEPVRLRLAAALDTATEKDDRRQIEAALRVLNGPKLPPAIPTT